MKTVIISFVLMSLFTPTAFAITVELKGVFSQKSAVLLIDGQQHVLDVGETVNDVFLEEVDSNRVKLRVGKQLREVFMSRQVGGEYKPPIVKDVRIPIGNNGHYQVDGTINNQPVKFVVDTGATLVSMNITTAKALGIDIEKGEKGVMKTANGDSDAYVVTLNTVSVGGIKQYNVGAVVALNDSLPFVLLGNSFLSKVNITQKDGTMTLSSDL